MVTIQLDERQRELVVRLLQTEHEIAKQSLANATKRKAPHYDHEQRTRLALDTLYALQSPR